MTAASLVQRFGSKRALLLAAAADVAGGHVYIFHTLRKKHRSPVAAILGLADCMGIMGSTPEQVAHSLAFLQIDLTDPAFLAYARAGSLGTREGIRALVRDAIAAGELKKCDTAAARARAARGAERVHARLGDPSRRRHVHVDPARPEDGARSRTGRRHRRRPSRWPEPAVTRRHPSLPVVPVFAGATVI